MAIISARVNDQTKLQAEQIADRIGLSLSSVINVFLNKFVAEQGFPFSVTAGKNEERMFDTKTLEGLAAEAVKNHDSAVLPPSMFIDPKTGEIRYTGR